MIERKITPRLLQLLQKREEQNNVLLLEGARQVGKTTLVRHVLKKTKHPFLEINLEEKRELSEKIDLCTDFDEFTQLLAVELGFSPGGETVLFIDEAQESRRLGSFVRFMKEKWHFTQTILSGSIMSRLFRDDTRYPVGRVTLLHLQPFSFEEFLLARGEEALLKIITSFPERTNISANTHQRFLEMLEQYFTIGGLPDAVIASASQDGEWKQVREQILLGYYNDFKRVFGEEKQAYFIASLKATASLLGSPFKNSHVAAMLDGAKNKEIIESLSRLEAWKMVYKVEQRGPIAESSFHPKRFLFDIGIARHLREMALPQAPLFLNDMTRRIPLGGLIENVTASVLISDTPELSGWKKSSAGPEIDFIFKEGKDILPLECKATLSLKNTHLRGMIDFLKSSGSPLGIVVSLAPFEQRQLSDGKSIINIPLYLMERWREGRRSSSSP